MVQNLAQIPFEEPQVPSEVTPNGSNNGVGGSPGSKRVRFGGESSFEDGFENHQQNLLNNTVLEAGRVGLESVTESAFGERIGSVVWGAEERVGLVVPDETTADNGVAEREEGVEDWGVDCVAWRESSRGVGAGALVGEEPEVEVGEETGEVGEGGG